MIRLCFCTLLLIPLFIAAEPLQQPQVIYQNKPSGRVYGSDGSVYDKLPTGKVYDAQGKAYSSKSGQVITGTANSIAKPLPRANTAVRSADSTRIVVPKR